MWCQMLPRLLNLVYSWLPCRWKQYHLDAARLREVIDVHQDFYAATRQLDHYLDGATSVNEYTYLCRIGNVYIHCVSTYGYSCLAQCVVHIGFKQK